MAGRDATRANDLCTIGDAELVRLARQKDEHAFRAIMQRNNRRLSRVARSVVHDDAEAEDVVQAAYVSAFSSLDQFAAMPVLQPGSLASPSTKRSAACADSGQQWDLQSLMRSLPTNLKSSRFR